MAKRGTSDWQCPPFTADAEDRMAWVEEQIEEGEGWLGGQSAYRNLGKNMRVFDAVFNDCTKSTLVTNELKYDMRKFVETLSDLREIGTYGSDAPQYKNFVEMLNRMVRAVYLETNFPTQLRKALQYAAVMGRGYLWPHVRTRNYGFGERQLVFDPLSILDVVPVQVPETNDVQDAYAVTLYLYMPIAEAHGRFPLWQKDLKPVDHMNFRTRLSARRVDFAERYRYGTEGRNFGNLYCEIRLTFVRDIAINNYGSELPMGEPGTSWFYKVPTVGQDIAAGVRNGQPFIRKAQPEDCLIYPYLRLIISNKGMKTPMYDGPAYDWHGEIPVVQYDVDDWPWEGMGRSLVGDVASIENTIRKMERKIDQVITTSLNPPMGYDRTATGGPKIENFDLFEEDVRAGMDGKPTEVFHSLLPETVRVEGNHFQWLQYLAQKRGKQLGLEDVGNLANLRMNLASEQADKILESVGPVAKGIAANIEKANGQIAFQLKFMIPQWYDTARVVSIVGPDNVAPEVFDFDPHSLVPSHLAEEYIQGVPPQDPSYYSQMDRARRFSKNIRLISVPSTLLRITQMQEQLKWLQLWRAQAPIAFSDVAKKMDIENYGEVQGATLRERWFNEKMEDMKLQAMAAAAAQKLGLMQPGGGGQPQKGHGKGGGGARQQGAGRPPTGQAPPRLRQKGDGRTVVAESR